MVRAGRGWGKEMGGVCLPAPSVEAKRGVVWMSVKGVRTFGDLEHSDAAGKVQF